MLRIKSRIRFLSLMLVIHKLFYHSLARCVTQITRLTLLNIYIILYRLTDEYERPVMIDVVVEEALTTRRQNASIQVTLHKHKYTMELIKTSEYFKPGLKYTAFVSMSYYGTFNSRECSN